MEAVVASDLGCMITFDKRELVYMGMSANAGSWIGWSWDARVMGVVVGIPPEIWGVRYVCYCSRRCRPSSDFVGSYRRRYPHPNQEHDISLVVDGSPDDALMIQGGSSFTIL